MSTCLLCGTSCGGGCASGPNSHDPVCPTCDGFGRVVGVSPDPDEVGWDAHIMVYCPDCDGEGTP